MLCVRFFSRFAFRAAAAVAVVVPLWASAQHAASAGHAHPAPAAVSNPAPAAGAAPVLDAHTREDIERHQGMARAHTLAAQCLAAGQPAEQCQKQLQTACKGLALGKNCGMRHSH